MNVNKIVSLFHDGKHHEIISAIDKEEMEGKEISDRIKYYQALSYIQIGKKNKALALLDEIVQEETDEENPIVYQCRMLRGYLFCATKKYDVSLQEFNTLIEQGYESSMLFAALGHTAFKKNDIPQAIKYLEKSLSLDENNLNALNSMSYILAYEGNNLELSIHYIEKVLRMEPRNPVYLDTYGVVLFKMNQFKEAEKVLSHAYSIHAHDTIKKHLDQARGALATV